MGGGASKSHTSKSAESPSNDQQHREKRDVKELQAEAPHSSPRTRPEPASRSQTQVIFGNEHDVGHRGSLSPHSSGDDFEIRPSHDGEEEDEYDEECEEVEESEEAMQLRMLFAQSAMSMDMDNEDLIFNLLYFGGDTSNFASMMNNAAEETVAAHSAGNTPYKLTPATEMALNKLKVMTVTEQLVRDLNLQECSICQEELDVGSNIAEIPGCGHCFHNECVLKWFALQSWCPVCRTKILPDDDCCGGEEEDEHNHVSAVSKGVSSDSIMDVKSNLGARFSDAANDRMEDVD